MIKWVCALNRADELISISLIQKRFSKSIYKKNSFPRRRFSPALQEGEIASCRLNIAYNVKRYKRVDYYLFFRLMAAWAAASRAIGTRKGEQET